MCSHGKLPQGNAETWWESQCLAQCAHMEACHKKMQKHAVNHNAYTFFSMPAFCMVKVGLSALVVPWFSWSLVLIVLGLLGLLGLVLVASWHSSVGQSPGSSGSMAFGILCRWHSPWISGPRSRTCSLGWSSAGPSTAAHWLGLPPAWTNLPCLVALACNTMMVAHIGHMWCHGHLGAHLLLWHFPWHHLLRLHVPWLAIWKHSVLGASWL